MKTTTINRNLAVMIALSLITTGAFSQETIRQNRRGEDTKKGREVTESRKQEDYRQKSRQDYNTNNLSDNKHSDARNGNSQSNKNHGYSKGHDKNKSYNHYQSGHNHRKPVHVAHKRDHQRVYHRHFSERRINRFQHHGMDYYHVNNRFYRYHPGYGYYLVDAPYAYVRHLPPGFFVRYYNGNSYIFANGFMYLPFESGYFLVPQPERPSFSLNIVLN